MSDVMLHGILRMPLEMAMSDKISQYQFYQTAQEALDRMVKAEERVAKLEKVLDLAMRYGSFEQGSGAIKEIKTALKEQTNAEPVGYIPEIGLKTLTNEVKFCVVNATKFDDTDIPLYTTPQTKPLSDEEIMKLWCLPELNTENEEQVFAVRFARAIEERILGK